MGSLLKETNSILQGKSVKDMFYKNIANGVSVFTYKGYMVRLAHNKDEYLRLSCSSEDILIDLIPLGDEVMKSNIIASYLMDIDDYNELLHTAEWNSNPLNRQRELKENDNLGFRCINLRLYNECEKSTKDRSNVKKLRMGLF
ncbi:MAG: hypothetical protein PHT75_02490 [Bacilli bacterium]|nr:hypothetical protein [Bacilli bacterium]MDD3304980.1 hypothetical protein [Bacilli bacterium]MDD4053860.1 hypothetical protein [Bacilli bacterium]MDD4411050.1 hypothetical protein [Bacilli bacterium]